MLTLERDGAPGLAPGWSEMGNRGCVFMREMGARRVGSVRLDPQAPSGRIPARSREFPEPTTQLHVRRLDSLLSCPIPPHVSLHPAPPTPSAGSWRCGVASPIPAVPLPFSSPQAFLTHNPVSFPIPSNIPFLTHAHNRFFSPHSSYASTGPSPSCHSDAHPAPAPFPSRPVPREACTQHLPVLGAACLSMRLSRASASPLHSAGLLLPQRVSLPSGLAPAIFYCCVHAAPVLYPRFYLSYSSVLEGEQQKPKPQWCQPATLSAFHDPGDRLPAPATTPHFLISPSELRINYLAAHGKHQECLKHAELRL